MASGKGPRKKGQPSIKHSCNFAEAKRKLSKISDHEHVEDHPQRRTRPRGSSKLSQMLSRDALISAVDLMWDRSDSTGSPAEQKANKSQLVRGSEKMCYRQSLEARWERDKLYSWMEGVAPTITRLHKGDAEIEKQESCCAEEGHSTPRSPLLEPSRSMDNPHEDSLSILEGDRKDKEHEACSSFAKHGHAFAGALAGVSVSLCLHPLDTVKTMIQSCRFQDKSLCYTGRSIISERGVSGLYRGIASNIASSAPISALYTFTYESVKGALLPVFPKEYCSLAHCVAGGSASVATSFIFTPSERIKQQMQVSSHYRNCWTALVGIIQKGGLLSLYAGWSAVLCRNIPHSIIKFYVYENMKRMVLPSIGPCGQAAQPTTLQTLVCGGLAGSAAAFFTTPFDVVKTRLQTQIPGSKTQHPSVYQALQSIRKREGPRGLYRGLIPRLVMYMSQGAIFFASYEFYKSILSLEDLSARWHKTKDGDNPNPL